MSNSYHEMLDKILASKPRGKIKPGLERINTLLATLDNPHWGSKGVLVAGTNGKGSVSSVVESICRAAGLRTVLFTSPHLHSYRERIRINGELINEKSFSQHLDKIQAAIQSTNEDMQPTIFETLTVVCALAVQEEQPDVFICETGLGGRLDCTNVFDLGVAVVTSIAKDHEEYLGITLEAIAMEKAGIIKADNHVVIGARGAEGRLIADYARKVSAHSIWLREEQPKPEGITRGTVGIAVKINRGVKQKPLSLHCPLPGTFQIDNLQVAVAAVEALSQRGFAIDDSAIKQGAATVSWPGRLQWLPGRPSFLLDAGHNPAGIAAALPEVLAICGERPKVLLFAAMSDKDAVGMLDPLRQLTNTVVFTEPSTERARSAIELAKLWGAGSRAVISLPDAIKTAELLAGKDGVVFVCGSVYLIGDVLQLLETRPKKKSAAA